MTIYEHFSTYTQVQLLTFQLLNRDKDNNNPYIGILHALLPNFFHIHLIFF